MRLPRKRYHYACNKTQQKDAARKSSSSTSSWSHFCERRPVVRLSDFIANMLSERSANSNLQPPPTEVRKTKGLLSETWEHVWSPSHTRRKSSGVPRKINGLGWPWLIEVLRMGCQTRYSHHECASYNHWSWLSSRLIQVDPSIHIDWNMATWEPELWCC